MFTVTHVFNLKVIKAFDNLIKELILSVTKKQAPSTEVGLYLCEEVVGSLSLFPSRCKKQKQPKNLLSFAKLQGTTSGDFSGSCC